MKFSRVFPCCLQAVAAPVAALYCLAFLESAAVLSSPVSLGHSHCGFRSLLVTAPRSLGLRCLLPPFLSAPHGELARVCVWGGVREASAWLPILASHAGPGDLEPVPVSLWLTFVFCQVDVARPGTTSHVARQLTCARRGSPGFTPTPLWVVTAHPQGTVGILNN